jgi:hypothetical protein
VIAHPARPPLVALSGATLAWVVFEWAPGHLSPDAQAVLFLAWSLPLAGLLAHELRAPSALVERHELLGQPRESLLAVLADHH